MDRTAPPTMISAIGTAVCSPPSPAIGAMVPAATHWTNPRTAEPVPGCSGTSAEARAPPLAIIRPWALISTKKQPTASSSGVPNHTAPASITTAAASAATCPADHHRPAAGEALHQPRHHQHPDRWSQRAHDRGHRHHRQGDEQRPAPAALVRHRATDQLPQSHADEERGQGELHLRRRRGQIVGHPRERRHVHVGGQRRDGGQEDHRGDQPGRQSDLATGDRRYGVGRRKKHEISTPSSGAARKSPMMGVLTGYPSTTTLVAPAGDSGAGQGQGDLAACAVTGAHHGEPGCAPVRVSAGCRCR